MQRCGVGEIVKQHITLCLLVTGNRAVVVIDVPVQLDQGFFILIDIGGIKGTRIKTVNGLENFDGLVYISLCDPDNIFDGLGV